MLCDVGMQQCAMHNATIQKTTFFELGVNTVLKDKDSLIEKIFCTDNEHTLFYLLNFINFSQNENRHPKIAK